MKYDAEDAAHTTFVRLCRSRDDAATDQLVLSRAAMQLHTFGVLSSIEAGSPGFVSDAYLNAVNTDTSITALELCLAGLWERTMRGYLVSDADTVSVAEQIHDQLDELAARCVRAGGHVTGQPGGGDVCARCGSAFAHINAERNHPRARPDTV